VEEEMPISLDESHTYEQQLEIFERLASEIESVLEKFGSHDSLEPGDYSIYDGYWGYPQVKLSIVNLNMLEPVVIQGLQEVIKAFPGWEIVVAVVNRDNSSDWPEMGLYIRAHEIVDGLQRQYFPKEFRDIQYKGARRGSVDD
jgi:hypothetical protein